MISALESARQDDQGGIKERQNGASCDRRHTLPTRPAADGSVPAVVPDAWRAALVAAVLPSPWSVSADGGWVKHAPPAGGAPRRLFAVDAEGRLVDPPPTMTPRPQRNRPARRSRPCSMPSSNALRCDRPLGGPRACGCASREVQGPPLTPGVWLQGDPAAWQPQMEHHHQLWHTLRIAVLSAAWTLRGWPNPAKGGRRRDRKTTKTSMIM
jgi:hypothetical protein